MPNDPVRRDDVRPMIIHGVAQYLGKLMTEEFYGVVQVQFQKGEIVLVRKEESFKPQIFLVYE